MTLVVASNETLVALFIAFFKKKSLLWACEPRRRSGWLTSTSLGLETSKGLRPSFFFLAHLSRRLTGELIGYPWIRRPSSSSVRRPFTFSNVFSSETAWPIKAKFYVEPPWEGGTKVCINGPGHMTKMAATPIYVKNLKKSSSPEPAGRFPRNLVCSIGDSCPS